MKKIVTVPPDVQLKDPVNGQVGASVSFRQFVREMLLSDAAFVANYDSIRAAARIDAAIAGGAGSVVFDLTDWEKLVKVVKTPSGGRFAQNTLPMIQLLPFMDAIIGAADQT
jgi:hypothetical protein